MLCTKVYSRFLPYVIISKDMKKLRKLVRDTKQVVFLDLEGTQFSHELIALGAVKVTLKKDGTFKKVYPGFKIYVLAKNNIGHVVMDLTGITSDLLAKEGCSFPEALVLFRKYVGANFSKSKFITFGNHDLRILRQSLLLNPEANHGYIKTIGQNYIDLSALVNEYVKDDNNNTFSLTNLCKIFSISPIEPSHDPLNDALMLAALYKELLIQDDLLVKYYQKTLLKMNSVPRPIKKLINKLQKDGQVNLEDFNLYVKEEIK